MAHPDDKPTSGTEAPGTEAPGTEALGTEAASTAERQKPAETPEQQNPVQENPVQENPAQETPEQETPEQRRRRLEAVFGDVLPDTTSDERDQDDVRRDGGSDAWLRDQVPPHHG